MVGLIRTKKVGQDINIIQFLGGLKANLTKSTRGNQEEIKIGMPVFTVFSVFSQ